MPAVFTVISRSVFLAVSWTWIIGMFLPVLLVKDFGGWSFVPFAVANVLGAMSVGVVLSAKKAQSAYETDLSARLLFSIATIAFHVFFVAALAGRYVPEVLGRLPQVGEAEGQIAVNAPEASAVVVLLLLMIPYSIARKERPEWVRGCLAIAVFAVSASCAAAAYFSAGDAPALRAPSADGEFGTGALLFTSAGIVFGFALCPYLDQSIVRVRAITPGGRGRLVSVLGFGVFFLSMILLTLAYSGAFLDQRGFSAFVLLHIFAQSVFTVGVHMGELRRAAVAHRAVPKSGLFWGTLFACGVSAAAGVFTHPEAVSLAHQKGFVLVYQSFLSLYGLAFPLYVWALMVPVPPLGRAPRRTRMLAFWLALAVSMGPFGYGYLAHEWWLVGLGVGLAILTPLAAAAALKNKG